jgi:hypothetical protein
VENQFAKRSREEAKFLRRQANGNERKPEESHTTHRLQVTKENFKAESITTKLFCWSTFTTTMSGNIWKNDPFTTFKLPNTWTTETETQITDFLGVQIKTGYDM